MRSFRLRCRPLRQNANWGVYGFDQHEAVPTQRHSLVQVRSLSRKAVTLPWPRYTALVRTEGSTELPVQSGKSERVMDCALPPEPPLDRD